jgi:hypothetical protein
MPEAPPKMPSFPRGCGWTLIAFGVPCLIVGLISIAAVPVVLQRSKEILTETPATIVETFVERGERRGSKTGYKGKKRSVAVTFTVMLRYDYEVEGKTYRGESKCLDQPTDDEEYALAAGIMERYPPGKAIQVYRHPAKVDQTRLTPKEPKQDVILDFVFTGLFTLLGMLCLWWGRGILKRRGRSRS